MKDKLIILIIFFSFTSCNKLDKATSNKVDRILTSEHFELITYSAYCMSNNMTSLVKDRNDTLTFKTQIDTSLVVKRFFTIDRKDKIRVLLEKGYNKKRPHDTAPGNGNRYYWLLSDKDTIRFFNNNQNIYKIFLEINGETMEHLNSLDSIAFKTMK